MCFIGVCFDNKIAPSTGTCNNADELQKCYAESEKSDKKDYILYISIYMKLWKPSSNCERSGLMWGYQSGYQRGMQAKKNEEIILVCWNVLYLHNVGVHMSIYIFHQLLNCTLKICTFYWKLIKPPSKERQTFTQNRR